MSKALLVVSFGTSYEATRKATLEAIEDTLKETFPERTFYRAWTSGRILKKLKANGGPVYDTVPEALERMAADGVTDVLVQPTFMVDGYEMKLTAQAVAAARARFERVALGAPLLTTAADLDAFARFLEQTFADAVGAEDMLVLMGHGSEETSFNVYQMLEYSLRRDGYRRFAVGTVEFDPGFDAVLEQVRDDKPKTVYLAPLLIVAGDHATNDMAGDEPDSWKSQLEREGVQVQCILRGLGEYPAVREMFAALAKAAKEI